MGRILIGAKLRERRKALGITQVALAARVGISASYLNLIEGDRRNIAGVLLQRLAQELGSPLEDFGGAVQRRLVDTLAELTGDPLLAPLQLDPASAADLVARNPAWARALVQLHRAYTDRDEAAAVLADRLTHDPFVSETVHSMLTNVSAIRSAAEILDGEGAIAPVQRRRFVSIIADDSRKLSDVSQALVGFFTQARSATRPLAPAQEVDDFFAARENHFARLEEAAQALRAAAGLGDAYPGARLADHLRDAHGVEVTLVPSPGGPGPRRLRSWYDAAARKLEVLTVAPEPTVRFEMARLAARLDAAAAVASELADGGAALSAPAVEAARGALHAYLAAAMLMPYEAFLAAARSTRYDVDQLARRFNASVEQVCHRLVTLRRPGAQGVRFGLLRCDAAGRVTKHFALPRLPLTAQGPGCPLWALFVAFQTPGATVRQLAQFPGGDRYLMVARAVEKERAPFGMPRHLVSLMLVCETPHAGQLVYGDDLDLSDRVPAVPVGHGCRVCARTGCAHRQEDAILALATRAPGEAMVPNRRVSP